MTICHDLLTVSATVIVRESRILNIYLGINDDFYYRLKIKLHFTDRGRDHGDKAGLEHMEQYGISTFHCNSKHRGNLIWDSGTADHAFYIIHIRAVAEGYILCFLFSTIGSKRRHLR